MDVFTAVKSRREVREYKEATPPVEHILKILEAGRLSPSSKNTQPWHFIVITDKKKLEEISRLTPTGSFIKRAAFAIALLMEPWASRPEIDAGRAMQQMMLVAWELGLGSCWVSNFKEDEVKKLLKAPGRLRLVTVVPFGYPARGPRGRKLRKELHEVAHWNEFGSKHPSFYKQTGGPTA